jgi:hypothetical protein
LLDLGLERKRLFGHGVLSRLEFSGLDERLAIV